MMLHASSRAGHAVALVIFLVAIAGAVGGQEITAGADGIFRTRPIKNRVPLAAGRLIEIRAAASLRGSLSITVHEADSAVLIYRKSAKTDSKTRAIDYVDVIALGLTSTPGGARLEMRSPNPAPWREGEYGAADVELRLPVECEVDIDATYFDLEATGPFRSLVDNSSLGRLQVSGVTERLKLATANQKVVIQDVAGSISAATSNATLTVFKANCSEENIDLRNENGDIKADHITGGLNIRNSYGRIEVTNFRSHGQNSFVRSTAGPISLAATELTRCQLLVSNRYEDIELWLPVEISAVLALAVDESGHIEVGNLQVKSEMVQPNRLNLVAGAGNGLINASIRGNGNVYVRGIDEGE
ncbi:MAG: hypothetical protein ABIE70_09735 [bacterium]